jgi:hypothetical protein
VPVPGIRSLMAPEREDPDALADEMEQEADRLEDRSKELAEDVDDVRKDWERKRSDQSVPGATPPADDEDQTSGQGSDVPSEREAGHD